mmetsp:Transcript_13442/g.37767  ORF Transcript_13442/g.37767 Transcript_13442/m.37767 type:complete len:374 (-) Transcript_13442:333-1454(-)
MHVDKDKESLFAHPSFHAVASRRPPSLRSFLYPQPKQTSYKTLASCSPASPRVRDSSSSIRLPLLGSRRALGLRSEVAREPESQGPRERPHQVQRVVLEILRGEGPPQRPGRVDARDAHQGRGHRDQEQASESNDWPLREHDHAQGADGQGRGDLDAEDKVVPQVREVGHRGLHALRGEPEPGQGVPREDASHDASRHRGRDRSYRRTEPDPLGLLLLLELLLPAPRPRPLGLLLLLSQSLRQEGGQLHRRIRRTCVVQQELEPHDRHNERHRGPQLVHSQHKRHRQGIPLSNRPGCRCSELLHRTPTTHHNSRLKKQKQKQKQTSSSTSSSTCSSLSLSLSLPSSVVLTPRRERRTIGTRRRRGREEETRIL